MTCSRISGITIISTVRAIRVLGTNGREKRLGQGHRILGFARGRAVSRSEGITFSPFAINIRYHEPFVGNAVAADRPLSYVLGA